MKSKQLTHLQQQFLASLHQGITPWLLESVQPANGFSTASEILNIYLNRAVHRTIDPLYDIFKCLRWLVGDSNFEKLIENFYASSPGEPLSAQALATELASYLGNLDQKTLDALAKNIPTSKQNAKWSTSQALMAASMLDWRCNWVSLNTPNRNTNTDKLIRDLHHHSHIWTRPRLNPSSRVCESGFELEKFYDLVTSNATSQPIPVVEEGSANFLIHANRNEIAIVRRIDDAEARLLNHCDGTHTYASLRHEATFHGHTDNDTEELVKRLILEGVIVTLKEEYV